jgi:hypothetical protein
VVIVTLVALPPNVLPLTLKDVFPHELPLLLLNVTVGGFEHVQATRKLLPVVMQPDEFRTEIV